MITSRHIDDLVLPARMRCVAHLTACRKRFLEVIVICTLRDEEAQNALYAIGRTREQLDAAKLYHINPKPGKIVTNAKGGWSMHQWKCAYDLGVLRHGKLVWSTAGNGIDSDPSDDETDDLELWQRVGVAGEDSGLEWAGRWKTFREYPHFQYPNGLTIADFMAGKTNPQDA